MFKNIGFKSEMSDLFCQLLPEQVAINERVFSFFLSGSVRILLFSQFCRLQTMRED